MSLRLFTYYCALCGGWAGLAGWALGSAIAPTNPIGRAGIIGMFVGTFLAPSLAVVGAFRQELPSRTSIVVLRGVSAAPVGALAGLLGGILGQLLSQVTAVLSIAGWTVAGLGVGASVAIYELVAALIQQTELRSARIAIAQSSAGGAVGGLTGGALGLILGQFLTRILSGGQAVWLWTPQAVAFVGLGACVGLFVGLAQMIMRKTEPRTEP